MTVYYIIFKENNIVVQLSKSYLLFSPGNFQAKCVRIVCYYNNL